MRRRKSERLSLVDEPGCVLAVLSGGACDGMEVWVPADLPPVIYARAPIKYVSTDINDILTTRVLSYSLSSVVRRDMAGGYPQRLVYRYDKAEP